MGVLRFDGKILREQAIAELRAAIGASVGGPQAHYYLGQHFARLGHGRAAPRISFAIKFRP